MIREIIDGYLILRQEPNCLGNYWQTKMTLQDAFNRGLLSDNEVEDWQAELSHGGGTNPDAQKQAKFSETGDGVYGKASE